MQDMYNNPQGYELDWDSEITEDNPSFTLLPEGDYPFIVLNMERGRYEPTREGAKLPPCPMATLTIQLNAADGTSTTVNHRLYLHSSTAGRLGQFFVSIGLKPKGQKVRMAWDKVVTARGMCHVAIRNYTDRNGNERKSNEIREFLEPDPSQVPAWQPAAPAYQTPPPYQQPAPQQYGQQPQTYGQPQQGGFSTGATW